MREASPKGSNRQARGRGRRGDRRPGSRPPSFEVEPQRGETAALCCALSGLVDEDGRSPRAALADSLCPGLSCGRPSAFSPCGIGGIGRDVLSRDFPRQIRVRRQWPGYQGNTRRRDLRRGLAFPNPCDWLRRSMRKPPIKSVCSSWNAWKKTKVLKNVPRISTRSTKRGAS